MQYFGQYGRRIVRDGQAIVQEVKVVRGILLPVRSCLANLRVEQTVRVLRHTALRRAVIVRGRRNCPDMPHPTVEPTPNKLSVAESVLQELMQDQVYLSNDR